ncbi:YARHG domain-containing protein [Methylobacterium sp. J-078]|uniref:YARHG domain-containing protein n=1 Tax=Methylobacterium sp. J-078 TaxID=2836657 RepID=UPI001FBB763C|nr:YARHG domain-containing protein [Methylobacterium sp. J-078]MCJ2045404.1 YARHG domain-containing protein [Methylobacterium sp. J-078]
MRRLVSCAATAALLALALGASATARAGDGADATIVIAQVDAADCDGLWSERNAIFKAAGYCFRSARGIRAFGNAGCRFDDEADVPLSARERERVARIRATERRLGCTP